ncbi:44'-diaponeurosporenoate glycosyltransferase protein [Marine Group I thaumarchaeote SCGC AAA799-E16]|uniref:44'-diaponeurosporenoate glycosyltransferase protein n=4 Tax=Marine Group I TaxID=905826 RepID=A0A081RMQ2_9ARCH|nr:44'-diaponeurosporenoate glycosyltransferase protein [Marine Group I thaumarchaeote SCGC AAA799-N04]KER05716.1 44'-diaponeurosporenoate glycosyltransferase protein [Marine Group I thaumarchaeote SCGC AAA799-E16]KFM16640.1 44'-diaponeurosporenoate glycosyltransferase protein [Marine Group I thaumarchaeote SCGC AAA799-D11]KFM18693.1 44'-diaponeurosporenoate glycosyltransferase protein [Marine Group I thaumarchaeote SCGC RSA3]
MDLAFDVFNYSFSAILIGICGAWIFLIKTMIDSFRLTPYLDKFENTAKTSPKVSVILPARNEEEFLGKCLDSLIDQDYENYEIIVIDDSSEDSTGKIISEYAKENSKVIHVSARPKPEGWMGKNWACMEGYKQATGELLLFTDADTTHKKNVISLAASHLISFDLDALSTIPKMLTFDFWTKITLPMISTFLHTRFSALNVNNPSKKTGYFFGSFFILKKKTYEQVGTHEGVKHEIIEDGALGKKVKESGHKMKMVRGEHLIEAVWARDKVTLWNALKRLMIPLYLQSGKIAIGIFFAVLFLLFVPFPIFVASISFPADTISSKVLCATAFAASLLIYIGAVIEAKIGLELRYTHALFAPLGSLVVVLGFLSGLLQAKKTSSVTWRGRSYSMKDHSQSSISV